MYKTMAGPLLPYESEIYKITEQWKFEMCFLRSVARVTLWTLKRSGDIRSAGRISDYINKQCEHFERIK